MKFLQTDIEKLKKKYQTNESTKKIHLRGKKETMEQGNKLKYQLL